MRVFRIAKEQHIHDLSGTGARLYGGRWNRPGTSLLYTSPSRALATVEYLVHVPAAIMPRDLCIAVIEIPDKLSLAHVEVAELPGNWRVYPAPRELAELGSQWAQSGSSLMLRVPSAVVENEFNILVNPMYSDITKVKVVDVQPYTFDERLMR